MSADGVTSTSSHMAGASVSLDKLTDAVLAVLAGAPPGKVATDLDVHITDIVDAVETYQTAGHAALEAQVANREWYQVHVQFSNWHNSERIATSELAPRLDQLHASGLISAWWFMRKHPNWRLRLQPGKDSATVTMRTAVNAILGGLTVAGHITNWHPGRYEPEAPAFGGSTGIAIAHELFWHDSAAILDYLRSHSPSIGRRELSLLLCTILFRAAGLDRFECGDVWNHVAALRPLPSQIPVERTQELIDRSRALLSLGSARGCALFDTGSPLAFAAPWAAAFRHAGDALAQAARHAHLERGTRRILTHLVIFHWNRLGLPANTQAILARAASEALLPAGQGPYDV